MMDDWAGERSLLLVLVFRIALSALAFLTKGSEFRLLVGGEDGFNLFELFFDVGPHLFPVWFRIFVSRTCEEFTGLCG